MTADTAPRRASRSRVVAAIAAVNLVRLSRDRLGLFFIVVLPFLIILIFGVAGGGGPQTLRVGLIDHAGGVYATELRAGLEEQGTLELRDYDDAEVLAVAVRRGTETAGLVIPDDFDSRVDARQPAAVELLTAPAGGVAEAVRSAVSAVVAAQNARLQPAQVVAAELEIPLEQVERARPRALPAGGVTVVAERAEGSADEFNVDRSAAANLVLFVFITSLVGGSWLVETRRLGLSNRMFATPAEPPTILLGEASARFILAAGQAALIVVGSVLLFGVRWGDPLGVLAVVVLFSLVGTGAAMLIGALFSNAEQATAVAPPLGIGLGMIGGCMWPLEIMPAPMQVLGRLTPHAWALDGLIDVVNRGAGLTDILGPLSVLLAYAAALLVLATLVLRRRLLR